MFNTQINPSTVNDESIYVVDEYGKILENTNPLFLPNYIQAGKSTNSRQVSAVSLFNHDEYSPGNYTLVITDKIKKSR